MHVSRSKPRKKLVLINLLLSAIIIVSCNSEDNSLDFGGNQSSPNSWLIPQNEIIDGGPGKDGIPSIDNPVYAPASEYDFYRDDRLVIGVRINDNLYAFPHQILDWHEIVNDSDADSHFSITFCPLTGTGMCWKSDVANNNTQFGVSGLLFRNNLIMYDRDTDSYWSQMQLRSVHGERIGTNISTYDVVETTWETWRSMYPDSKVLTTDTGFQRNYSSFTYGQSYLTNDTYIIFPVRNVDDRLNNKDRVLGVFLPSDGTLKQVRAYPLKDFSNEITVETETINGVEYVIVGSQQHNFIRVFSHLNPEGSVAFEPIQDALPIIMVDDIGNYYDIFGNIQQGPNASESLNSPETYMGYWFAFADFYPDIQIFGR